MPPAAGKNGFFVVVATFMYFNPKPNCNPNPNLNPNPSPNPRNPSQQNFSRLAHIVPI